MFKTVIFDLDGTLLNTIDDLAAAGNHALSVLGFPTHPAESYKLMVGNSAGKLIERMLPPDQRGEATQKVAFEIYAKYYAAHINDLTGPYPGIPALLGNLKEAGVQLAVLSNKGEALVQELVQAHFPGVFDLVMGLRDGFLPKPDPGSVLEALRLLDADKASTLYVGDSDVDVFTAHNAQLPCCGVIWGFRGEDELRGAGADCLVADAAELEELVSK